MAKTDFGYFQKKYKVDSELQGMLKNKEYRNIMQNIFEVNLEEMSAKTGARSKKNWEQEFKKPQFQQRKYIVPEFQEIVPSTAEIKNRSRGQVQGISNNLRMQLTSNLRDRINSFKSRFKEETYIKRRVSGNLEAEMQKQIAETFQNFTKRDPALGVPSNVRTIAVTELRTAVSTIKSRTANAIQNANPGLKLKKRWIHNPHLSKSKANIRIGHAEISGKKILLDEYFDVPLYKVIMGIPLKIGSNKMMQPHDISAPPSQIIGCHCDCEYEP